ncbi:DUF2760 domain-containing protein [Candidatus Binatia bacterium]|nr:DUF2760 domain-containing protein [Candidatus Binatia bacterium]
MQQRTSGTTLIVIILLSGLVFAGSNLLVLLQTTADPMGIPVLEQFYRVCPPCVAYFVAAPFLVSILVALMVRRLTRVPVTPAAAEETPAATPPLSPELAVRLLGFLQQEGRLVDFLKEDIGAYNDAQVGAAVRAIHAGCRKTLDERVELERILDAEEGTTVTVETGFDPSAIRLSGNVTGAPPFRGVLQHAGWRATRVTLPPAPEGSNPNVVAPAEVEIP